MATRKLNSSPSMVPLFARAGVAAIPGASLLPFVGGRGQEIPDLTLTLSERAVGTDRLAEYDRVCGFALRDVLPATYPHILAFPLQLALMTDSSFPFGAIGLVHIANRITQHRPIRMNEKLDIKVWATALEDHPRGKQFSLRSEARVQDELVWEEVSTNLKRGGGSDANGSKPAQEKLPSAQDLPATSGAGTARSLAT